MAVGGGGGCHQNENFSSAKRPSETTGDGDRSPHQRVILNHMDIKPQQTTSQIST